MKMKNYILALALALGISSVGVNVYQLHLTREMRDTELTHTKEIEAYLMEHFDKLEDAGPCTIAGAIFNSPQPLRRLLGNDQSPRLRLMR